MSSLVADPSSFCLSSSALMPMTSSAVGLLGHAIWMKFTPYFCPMSSPLFSISRLSARCRLFLFGFLIIDLLRNIVGKHQQEPQGSGKSTRILGVRVSGLDVQQLLDRMSKSILKVNLYSLVPCILREPGIDCRDARGNTSAQFRIADVGEQLNVIRLLRRLHFVLR